VNTVILMEGGHRIRLTEISPDEVEEKLEKIRLRRSQGSDRKLEGIEPTTEPASDETYESVFVDPDRIVGLIAQNDDLIGVTLV
jgi:hypothetical protein